MDLLPAEQDSCKISSAVFSLSTDFNVCALVYQLAQQLGLNEFLSAVQTADSSLSQLLTGNQQYTIFAPSDAAFASLRASSDLGSILQDPVRLRQVLRYHIVPGLVPIDALSYGSVNSIPFQFG